MTTSIVRVCGTSFITGFAAIEMGCGGYNLKSSYLRVVGQNEYLWGTKNDGSTGPGVDTGIDPGTYVAELAGYSGLQVIYPAGLVSAGSRAAILAAMLLTRTWVDSVTVAGADNADGSRSIEVIGDYTSIAPGSRTWAARGAAGQFGSHVFRPAADVPGAINIPITRNIASAIATPPINAQFWGIGLQLGPVVSVVAANVPRLYLRAGGTAVDPDTSTMIFDFGQIPISQVVANSLAIITITPAQAAALRTALDGIGADQLWICAKSTAITEYVGLPTGGGWNGQLADTSIRVDDVTSADPTTPAPVAWNSAGMLSFGFLLSARLLYEVDPPGNANSFPILGSLRDLSTFPDAVVLPDTETLMTSLPGVGYDDDYKIFQTEIFFDAGPIRQCYDSGGNSPGLDMTGAVTILDLGQTAVTGGVVTTLAPTGDSAIAVPTTISYRFKGVGSTGRGALNPLNNTPIEPNDYINVVDGGSPREFDYAAPGGDSNVPFASPIVAAATFPDNLPALRTTFVHLADTVELIPPPIPPVPPVPPTPTPTVFNAGGGGGGGVGFPLSFWQAQTQAQQAKQESYVVVEGPIGWLYIDANAPVLVKILSEEEDIVYVDLITEAEALELLIECQDDPECLGVDLEPPSRLEARSRLRKAEFRQDEDTEDFAPDEVLEEFVPVEVQHQAVQNPQRFAPRRVFSSGGGRIFSRRGRA